MKNNCFKNSFKNAISGIINSIKNERNMRIHLSVFNLIIIFAYFYGLSRAEWAVLLITCASVIGAELINTAIENAVDTFTDKICETARISKDSSAGAVLFFSITSVLVGFMLFFDIDKIADTLIYIFTNLKILIPCLIIGVLDIIFIIFGGRKNA